uniref:Uncharacterized protein n=1 Tax=viral metagenome TaxID=1070528 RepID=A0A6C0DCD9_9ZZZZ
MATALANVGKYLSNGFQAVSTTVKQTASTIATPFGGQPSPIGTTSTSSWSPFSGSTGSTWSPFSGSTSSTYSGPASSFGQIGTYIIAILIILLVIVLFVHFFITPIFRFHAGDVKGIITIPGFDDGVLFWTNSNVGQIKSIDLPIPQLAFGYSMILDIFIENPMQFSTRPRILFTRGATVRETPNSDTLLGMLENYNLAIALLPDTTDLIVSVLNKDNNMENVIIPNVPVQEPFRLGVVVMEHALEVYLNGYLMKTRKFLATPKDVKGDIFPASGIQTNLVKLRTLKIWPRVISTGEMRESQPALTAAKSFGAGPMPASSTSCSS